MSDILNFILTGSKEFGLIPTLLILVGLGLGWYLMKVIGRKDSMLKEIVDKQELSQKETNEAVASAIANIEKLTVMNLQEITRLTGQVSGVIDIVKTLVTERHGD